MPSPKPAPVNPFGRSVGVPVDQRASPPGGPDPGPGGPDPGPGGEASMPSAPEDVAVLAKDGVAFALALKAVLREPGNQFFSPYSIASAVALLQLGARGATASEITAALRSSLPPERLHAAMAGLGAVLLAQKGAELKAQSALWPSRRLSIDPAFLASARRFYGAEPEALDYGNPREAAGRINDWVERGTQGKIKDLIAPDALTPETRLVLTNAVYFKGSWPEAFRKGYTENQPFFRLRGEPVNVPLMSGTRDIRYAETDSLQVAELPYRGDRFAMVILLPKEKRGLGALEASLTAQALEGWLRRLSHRSVELLIPRFKLEVSLDLGSVLKALGVRTSFGNSADFSGIDRSNQIKVDAAIHKAFVDVNEEGTEAAAATGIMMLSKSLDEEDSNPVFRADHPFLFLILDRKSGAILFLGRLEEPR